MANEKDREFRACHRFARISPRKARYVMDLIRGLPVDKALDDLRFSLKRATPMISKVIKSAMANATQEAGVETSSLYIHQAMVDVGPRVMRFKARAMGRARPRMRRFAHLSVVLRERKETEKKERSKSGRRRAGEPAAPAAPEAKAGTESKEKATS
jgi:large subunit ribosomal protein L22